jgi:4-azaleucine resistance transporter AzlC
MVVAVRAVDSTFSHFRQGTQAGLSIAIGYFPIALTFGLLAKSTGLSMMETVLMSLIVFAGASQYIALNLISLGTGVFEIVLTTFIVNIRHFLMSTTLTEKVEEDSLWAKITYAFGLTDETFSVIATREGKAATGFVFGVIVMAYGSWVIFSGVGHVFGAGLPQTLQESMGVALYAMFVGLLVPSLKGNRKYAFLALVAAAFNSIFTLGEILSTGWSIVLATLLSALLVEWIVYTKQKGGMVHG